MNPFEIFGLMAAAALVIQVLLAALLQLEARLMGEGRTTTEVDRRRRGFVGRPTDPAD